MARDPERPTSEREPNAEGFVRRWSRRKEQTRRAQETRAAPTAASPPAAAADEAPRVLTDADMPPLESLDEKSDFSLFLSPGVSEELRRLALRKLFRLPQFNERCPLDGEYYDCTNLEPLGSIVTYDMREEMKRAAEKLAETASDTPKRTDATGASEPQPPASPLPEARVPARADAGATPVKTRRATAGRRTRSRSKT
jgi:hypothetical protein